MQMLFPSLKRRGGAKRKPGRAQLQEKSRRGGRFDGTFCRTEHSVCANSVALRFFSYWRSHPSFSRRGKSTAVSILAICLAIAQVLGSAAQTSTVEYEVKAAFLYNFAKFVDWPPQAFGGAGDPFAFCVAGDAFAGALEKVLAAETLNGRRLLVRRIAPADNLQ